MPSIVALVPINSYDQEKTDEAVRLGLSLIGGIGQILRPEEKILIKPNLLGKALPQRAVTTHPSVFSSVAKELINAGFCHLSYGDSPGPASTPEAAATTCGIAAEAEKLHIPMADFHTVSSVDFPEGKVCKHFTFSKAITDADAIVNVCKMKTHALERITGAVKNMYGAVVGLNKGAGHVTYPDSFRFAEYVTDIHRYLKPRLHIMDGIVAMEGNGPNSGTPIAMNVLLFSTDAVALDAVFASLVYLDPSLVPTCLSGKLGNIGTYYADQIIIRTQDGDLTMEEARAKYGNPDFDVFRGTMKKSLLAKFLPLLPFLQERPVVERSKCIACGICENACPVPEKAVHSGKGKKAVYDYRKCIRCYCCQEMCPAKAIDVKHNPLQKLLRK